MDKKSTAPTTPTTPPTPTSPWTPKIHKTRTSRSQRLYGIHEKSVKSDSSRRSNASRGNAVRKDPLEKLRKSQGTPEEEIKTRRDTYAAPGKDSRIPVRNRGNTYDNVTSHPWGGSEAKDVESVDDAEAEETRKDSKIPMRKRGNIFDNVTSHPSEGSEATDEESVGDVEAEEARKATGLWVGRIREQAQADLPSPPPLSPYTERSQAGEAREGLQHGTARRFKRFPTRHENIAEGTFPVEYYPDSSDPDPESPFLPLDSGDVFFPEVKVRDFALSTPPNREKIDHGPRPQPSKSDHAIGGTAHPEVSDMGEDPGQTGTSSKISRPSESNKREGLDSQRPPSESEPTFTDASPIHDPDNGQFDLVSGEAKEALGTTRDPDTMEKESDDSHPRSPVSDRIESPQTSGSEPTLIDANPDQIGIDTYTAHFSDPVKEESHTSQPDSPVIDQMKSPQPSESGSPLLGANLIHQLIDPATETTRETATSTQSPSAVKYEDRGVQTESAGSDHIKSSKMQSDLPKSDYTKSLDLQLNSPELGGITFGMSPTQGPGEVHSEVTGAEAWLNSDAPLPKNYRAIFPEDLQSPSISPGSSAFGDDSDPSSSPTFRRDSLIIAPTMPDEQDAFEEDQNSSADMTKADFMMQIADHRAKPKLKAEEQEAKKERRARRAAKRQELGFRVWTQEKLSDASSSSDGSILVSHDEDDEEVFDAEEAKREEEVSQAAAKIFELQAVNYAMKKEFDTKEAKLKRDIIIAWTQPRPPPTTAEQRNDERALEKIKSKRMFDQLGDQQRPIGTDPRLVAHETDVNVMLNRAQVSYILDNIPKMYFHANKAAIAAATFKYAPLTARCCYYRGLAQYHARDFVEARKDFVEARACAGLYGISGEIIEKYIDHIDEADDPDTVILQRFRTPKFSEYQGARKGRVKTAKRDIDSENENEPLPSTADDAATLVGGSPSPSRGTTLASSPSRAPNQKERPAEQPREDASARSQSSRSPSHLGVSPLDADPGPATDEIPNYQPEEEAIAEEIRKDILNSKAESLVSSGEAGPAEGRAREIGKPASRSMASTELTLLGTAASQGTARRVPRPHVAPITTSIAAEMNDPVREAPPEATPVSGERDLLSVDEIMARFNTAREDATPNTPNFSDVSDFD